MRPEAIRVERLDLDYLILPDADRGCRFLKTAAYELKPIRRFGAAQAIGVYDVRRSGHPGRDEADATRP